MKTVKRLQQPRELPDKDGNPSGFRKGTSATAVEDGSRSYVEKEWIYGDWLFSAEYGYNVEKHIYQEANARGLSVPQLLDSDDTDRKLRVAYVEGERVGTPCSDLRYLSNALEFYDAFKTIRFPSTRELHTMGGAHMRDYELDQLKHSSFRPIWEQVDQIYQAFLSDIPHYTMPFDAILKNALVCSGKLVFMDFDWTIAGPHEFTLARLAVEFNAFDNTQILSRVEHPDLYHFLLLYFYGRAPELIDAYLQTRVPEGQLREFLDMNREAREAASRGKP